MPEFQLAQAFARDLHDDEFWLSAEELLLEVWPPPEIPIAQKRAPWLRSFSQNQPHEELFFVRKAQSAPVVAMARLFRREIFTESGPLGVGALAAVCVKPAWRGHGLGRRVVQAAFERVADGTYPAILFQTKVPLFYEKLGARVVSNRFVNRRSETPEANPWSVSPNVMVYPAAFAWPSGLIDLNGAQY